jgi:tellurite resistance protein TehA-like permease
MGRIRKTVDGSGRLRAGTDAGSWGANAAQAAAAVGSAARPAAPLADVLAETARDLSPGSFAVVMATGIVSIAAHLLDLDVVAWPLLGLNVVAYVALWLLLLARLRLYLPRVWADLTDHARGPGFFTLAAGTSVLGAQLLMVTGSTMAAAGLGAVGAVLWVALIYTFFAAVAIRHRKPGLEQGLNGSWLLTVVSTQGLCVLGAQLAPELPATELLLFLALTMYLLGCLLYVVLVALVVYRFVFVRLARAEFAPDYWITMGAAAITTLAGATLIASSGRWAFLSQMLPFLTGLTLLFWVGATWWIPLLAALDVWRHLPPERLPLVAGAKAWGRVFPLGMYGTATLQLARATGLTFLLPIPGYVVYLAMLAWLLTFIGVCREGVARRRKLLAGS